MALGIGLSTVFRHGCVDRPWGAITHPTVGFEFVDGDTETISGTCYARSGRSIASVVVMIRGVAIAESVTVDNVAHTWTVDHVLIDDDRWATATLTALITDSAGKITTTIGINGTIYPVEGTGHTYEYLPETGEFLVDGAAFVIKDGT